MNTQIFKQAQQLVAENSAALLTGTGVIGVVTTAILTGKASLKAHEVIARAEERQYSTRVAEDGEILEVTSQTSTLLIKEQAKLVWPLFVPAAASGVTTIGAIIFSYRISVSKSAALAAAYGISEKAFGEYKEKVLNHVTPKKAGEIKDDVAKKQITDNPPSTGMVIAEGDILCMDAFSGRYFRSNVERIRRAENDTNTKIAQYNESSLGDFYEKVGLPQTDISECFGWDIHHLCEIDYSTQLTDDGRPCVVITFSNAPRPKYDDFHN